MVHRANAAEFSIVCLLSADGGGGDVARLGAEPSLHVDGLGPSRFQMPTAGRRSNSMVVAPAANVTFWGEADGRRFFDEDRHDFRRGGCISGDRGAKSASNAKSLGPSSSGDRMGVLRGRRPCWQQRFTVIKSLARIR